MASNRGGRPGGPDREAAYRGQEPGGRLPAVTGEGEAAGLPEPVAELIEDGEIELTGDEVIVVEEWELVDPDEEQGSVLGWYRTEAAEGRDPNVGPAPRPGGPKPGGPRPGGPRPGVRPSGPPSE